MIAIDSNILIDFIGNDPVAAVRRFVAPLIDAVRQTR